MTNKLGILTAFSLAACGGCAHKPQPAVERVIYRKCLLPPTPQLPAISVLPKKFCKPPAVLCLDAQNLGMLIARDQMLVMWVKQALERCDMDPRKEPIQPAQPRPESGKKWTAAIRESRIWTRALGD